MIVNKFLSFCRIYANKAVGEVMSTASSSINHPQRQLSLINITMHWPDSLNIGLYLFTHVDYDCLVLSADCCVG